MYIIKTYGDNTLKFLLLVISINILYLLLDIVGYELNSIYRYIVNLVAFYYYLNGFSKVTYTKHSFFIFMLSFWIAIMFFMSLPDLFSNFKNFIYLKQFFSSILITYLFVLTINNNLSLDFIKGLFRFSYILIIIYSLISLPFFLYFAQDSDRGAEVLSNYLVGGASILLLTLPYHGNRKQVVIILSFILALFINIILARRNQVLFYSSTLTFSYFNIFTKGGIHTKKKIYNFLMLIFIFIFIVIFTQQFFSRPFDFFLERVATGMESREDIIELFQQDFNSNKLDWYTGRGMFGEFYGGSLMTNDVKGLRDGIENGYYFAILKGGGVYLALLIIISVIAVYKGFFRSNNLLVKGMAALILIYYIDMIGFGIPQVSLKYAMVFISIAGCNNKWLRECTDSFLMKNIGLR